MLWILILTTPAGGSARALPSITEFQLRRAGNPVGITAGPDQNLWFTKSGGNEIGRITTDGVPTEFRDPEGGHPWGITTGPDGNLWYTDLIKQGCCARIGRLSPPPDGQITEFPFEGFGGGTGTGPRPVEITSAPDGNLWFTVSKGRIGRMAPNGRYTFFGAPNGAWGITLGPDGYLWFTSSVNFPKSIWRMSLSGDLTSFPLPESLTGVSLDIAAGPDGNLWFTLYYDDAIGHITPDGDVTIFDLPNAGSAPYGIAAGPDGNMWFTEYLGNRVGQITPAGAITEYEVPTAEAHPIYIAAGPDGNMWFTEHSENKIGRVDL